MGRAESRTSQTTQKQGGLGGFMTRMGWRKKTPSYNQSGHEPYNPDGDETGIGGAEPVPGAETTRTEPAATEPVVSEPTITEPVSTSAPTLPETSYTTGAEEGLVSHETYTGGVSTILPVANSEDADKYKSIEGESAELAARSKGKQRAESISDVSDDPTRGRTSTLSDEQWSEARDQFEEEPPRVSSSPARGGSKFQEEL